MELIGKALKTVFMIGVALCLNSLFKHTNYNNWFSIALCLCSVHWITDTFEKIILEDKHDS